MKHDVKMGERYTENVHGREGVVTAVCYYVTGCTQVCLERLDKDNKVYEIWADITRLEKVVVSKKEQKLGGPQSHPQMNNEG